MGKRVEPIGKISVFTSFLFWVRGWGVYEEPVLHSGGRAGRWYQADRPGQDAGLRMG